MADSPLHVLFVGNSYTFTHDMPGQVSAMALADPYAPAIETDQVVQGGATLALHHAELGAPAKIAEGGWTHVVLQEKSTGTLHDADDYRTYVAQLGAGALAVGARVVLYETWARAEGHEVYRWGWSRRSPAAMLERVAAELRRAAAPLDAVIAPVGHAWARCLAKHPDLDLFDTDRHHPSPLGSHLAAAVFFVTLTGRDPTPLGFTPDGVEPDVARALRAVAWDVARAG